MLIDRNESRLETIAQIHEFLAGDRPCCICRPDRRSQAARHCGDDAQTLPMQSYLTAKERSACKRGGVHIGHSLCLKADSRGRGNGAPQHSSAEARATRIPGPNRRTNSISTSPGSQPPTRTPSALHHGPDRAGCAPPVRSRPTCRRCPLGSPTKSARISQLAQKPTVDPHDRTPNTQARVIETPMRQGDVGTHKAAGRSGWHR
jgi:hypothetical protein